MQYILTKEELDNLVPKQDNTDRDKALEIARKRILSLSGFQCIHEDSGHGFSRRCDGCPCLMRDDEAKQYENKIGSRSDLYQLHLKICPLTKSFSK